MHESLHHKAFLLLLALVTVAFCWLLLPFYGAVFWAVILAIVFQPLQRALERRLGRGSNTAALASVLVCVVIAIIPMTLIVASLVQQGAQLVERFQNGSIDLSAVLSSLHDSLPGWTKHLLERFGVGDFNVLRDRLVDGLRQASQTIATRALNIGQDTLRFFVAAGIMLYMLFFFFRDGRSIARNIRASMPLSDNYNQQLLLKFTAVVRATVKGNIVIALIQGTIGGIAFWFLGIGGALLWGTLMTFLSLLPAIGAALVWAPAAAYLIGTGDTGQGDHSDRHRKLRHRARRQSSEAHPGGQGHASARLRGARLDLGRALDLRHQRLRHRSAHRRSFRRGLDALPRGAGLRDRPTCTLRRGAAVCISPPHGLRESGLQERRARRAWRFSRS